MRRAGGDVGMMEWWNPGILECWNHALDFIFFGPSFIAVAPIDAGAVKFVRVSEREVTFR